MAVADAAVKPAPASPPRVVVAVLGFMRFVLAAMLVLGRFVFAAMLVLGRIAACAYPYLFYGTAWVIYAGSAARIIASHAYRNGSAILEFFEAFRDASLKFSINVAFLFLALAAALLCRLCLAYLDAVFSGSGSKSVFEVIRKESTKWSIKLPRALVLGLLADLPFILLIAAGILVGMMAPPVDGSISRGQMIGSVIVDVGIFGIHAISCFVIIPTIVLGIWRLDRKAGLTVADC